MTKAKFLKLKKITTPLGIEKKKKWILLFLPLVLSLAFQLHMSNSSVGRGGELSKIESQIEELKRENQILKEQIAKDYAITHLEEEGEKLGLTKPQSVVYAGKETATAEKSTTFLGQTNLGN